MVTHAVFLKTQYRMSGDPEYAAFVNRFRHGNSTLPDDDDYLLARQLTASNTLRDGHLKDVDHDPIIIVESNDLRYRINLVKAKEFAKATKQKLYFSVAVDQCSTNKLTAALRYKLLTLEDGSKTAYGAGLLPLAIGMPVMLKTNVATELSLANGSIGTIADIIIDPREDVDHEDVAAPHYLKFQPVVHVHFPDCEKFFTLPGLAAGVCPINTTYKTMSRRMAFDFKLRDVSATAKIPITRKQLCILPAFAITVNSSQGRTLDAAIIDLSNGNKRYTSSEKAYVMTSRLNNGTFFGVQGTWHASLWDTSPNATMISYLRRNLEPIEERTLNNLPSFSKLETTLQKLYTVSKRLKNR
jgi:hypothetical protein